MANRVDKFIRLNYYYVVYYFVQSIIPLDGKNTLHPCIIGCNLYICAWVVTRKAVLIYIHDCEAKQEYNSNSNYMYIGIMY